MSLFKWVSFQCDCLEKNPNFHKNLPEPLNNVVTRQDKLVYLLKYLLWALIVKKENSYAHRFSCFEVKINIDEDIQELIKLLGFEITRNNHCDVEIYEH